MRKGYTTGRASMIFSTPNQRSRGQGSKLARKYYAFVLSLSTYCGCLRRIFPVWLVRVVLRVRNPTLCGDRAACARLCVLEIFTAQRGNSDCFSRHLVDDIAWQCTRALVYRGCARKGGGKPSIPPPVARFGGDWDAVWTHVRQEL